MPMDKNTLTTFMPEQVLMSFLEYLKYEKNGGLSQNTIDRYVLNLRHLVGVAQKDPFEITSYSEISSIIRRLRIDRGWSASSAKNAGDTFSVFYNWAFRYGYIKESPLRLGHEFKNDKPLQIDFFDWDSEDFKKLVYHPNNSVRDNTIFHTLRASGLRAEEVCRLKQEHVDLEKRWLYVKDGKGGQGRHTPFDEEARSWLSMYIPQVKRISRLDWLFQDNQYQKAMTTSMLYKMIRRKGDKLGIHAYPHKFRKSLGGEMISRGADLTVVQHVLGHRSAQTTSRHYVGFKKGRLKELYDRYIQPDDNQKSA